MDHEKTKTTKQIFGEKAWRGHKGKSFLKNNFPNLKNELYGNHHNYSIQIYDFLIKFQMLGFENFKNIGIFK